MKDGRPLNVKALGGIAVRVMISALLLGLLFSWSDTGNVLQLAVSLNVFVFMICLFLMLVIHMIAAYRWHIFAKTDNPQVPVSKLFSFYLVGLFFNNFLPTAVGGDVVRSFDLYKYSGRGKAAVVSVLIERFAGMTAQVFVALIAVLIGYSYFKEPLIFWLVCGFSLSYLLFLVVFLNQRMMTWFIGFLSRLGLTKVQHLLSETYELFMRYQSSRLAMIQAMVLSLSIVMVSVFTFYLLSISLHLSVPFGYFVLFLPIITIVSMIPITLGGLGVREGIGVFLFSTIGVPPSDAFGLSLAWSLLLILISLLGGMIFAFRRTKGARFPSSREIVEMKQ